jgi:hypothetical protein
MNNVTFLNIDDLIIDTNNKVKDSRTMIIGNTHTGKSLLAMNILQHVKKYIQHGYVIDDSGKTFYDNVLINTDTYFSPKVKKYLNTKHDKFFIVDSTKLMFDYNMEESLNNINRLNIKTLIYLSDRLSNHFTCSSIDNLILFKFDNYDNIYKTFVCNNFLISKDEFDSLVRNYTNDFKCLVIDIKNKQLFYYKIC